MAFGLPAAYEEVRRYNVHHDYLASAVSRALADLGWRAFAYSPYQVEVRFPFSLLSYGERMNITIFQDGSIHAVSKCVFVLQWFDYGRNKKHVNEFFDRLTAVSGYRPVA
ncbi:MAG: hypothetical protein H5T73_11070 [Actinobacteria bacterium]|nr:hypothetical protein [Actinomycetota bacterium]